MIETKRVEIRDRMTMIPAIAMRVTGGPNDRLMWHAGFGDPCVILVHLTNERACYDPHHWGGHGRTMTVAHQWLEEHFDEHVDGGVVDVEYLLGETQTPKVSEFA